MPVAMTCERCGAAFSVKPSRAARGDTRFCSHRCKGASMRTLPDATCERCGKTYRPHSGRTGRNFCSAACYATFRRALPPDQRAALMVEATNRIRGTARSHADLCKRARTKQERAALSGDEAEIMAALVAAGFAPVPLLAIDKFNVDFGFPDRRIAVEYHGGNWHASPKKRAQDERKAAFLREAGWTLLVFPRLDRPRRNDSGNNRINLADMVRRIAEAVHSASASG